MFIRSRSLFLTSALALFSIAASGRTDARRDVFIVKLSGESSQRSAQMKQLSQFDLAGVDVEQQLAEVLVPAEHVQRFLNLGLSFVASKKAQVNAPTGYTKPDGVVAAFKEISAAHPSISRLVEIGRSHEGRPLLALILSSDPDDTNRPAILFNAMHHAREVMTTEVAIHMAQVLTSTAESDPEVARWLDQYRIVIVPQVNPDGNHLVHNGQAFWRKNAWRQGHVVGVDLNRNYPALWNYCSGSSGEPTSETFRGRQPASEPETRAMLQLVSSMRPVASISYHSFSEMIIYPFGCENVANPSVDLFRNIAVQMNKGIENDRGAVNRYSIGTAPELLYNADGADDDTFWRDYGVLAYTIEVNAMAQGFQPSYERWRNVTVRRQEGGWKNLLRRMNGGGVKAIVSAGVPLSEITFEVKKLVADKQISWTDASVRPFRLRSESGLLYQLLNDGKYVLTFKHQGAVLKEIAVTVDQGMNDLGQVQL